MDGRGAEASTVRDDRICHVVNDTTPAAAEHQIKLLREASLARRVRTARSLSRSAIELSRRALRRRRPDASEDEIGVAFVALHYGPELAARVDRRARP